MEGGNTVLRCSTLIDPLLRERAFYPARNENDDRGRFPIKMGSLPDHYCFVNNCKNHYMAKRPIAEHSRTKRIPYNWQHSRLLVQQ